MVAFRGGMEFQHNAPLRLAPPPETLPAQTIRLRCGERPEVIAGQIVRPGQLLLRSNRVGAACQVSPVAGTVKSVHPLPSGTGAHADAAGPAAAFGGGFEVTVAPASERIETSLPVEPPAERMLDPWIVALRQVGFGADPDGGVGLLPQLEAARHERPDLVICVGVDAFPPYPDRSSLLVSFPDDAALGTLIVADLVGAKTTVMLAAKLRPVLARMRPRCRDYGLRLQRAARSYPAADPTLVAWAYGQLAGGPRRRVRHRGNPAAQRVVLLEPWTAIRLARWFTLRRFDLVRPVFIAWPERGRPMTGAYALPGQSLASLDPGLARELEGDADQVILGNPLTGRRVGGARRTTAAEGEDASGVAAETGASPPVVPDDELLVSVLPAMPRRTPEPCVACGSCAEVCPTRLRPIDLARLAETRGNDERLARELPWCIDCGLCSHVCPTALPLTQTIRQAAARFAEGGLGRGVPRAARLGFTPADDGARPEAPRDVARGDRA